MEEEFLNKISQIDDFEDDHIDDNEESEDEAKDDEKEEKDDEEEEILPKNPILIGFLFFTKRVAFIRKLCKIVVLDYNRIISSSLRRQGCKQQRKQYHRLVYDTNITIK